MSRIDGDVNDAPATLQDDLIDVEQHITLDQCPNCSSQPRRRPVRRRYVSSVAFAVGACLATSYQLVDGWRSVSTMNVDRPQNILANAFEEMCEDPQVRQGQTVRLILEFGGHRRVASCELIEVEVRR